jgi:hypothetical protein
MEKKIRKQLNEMSSAKEKKVSNYLFQATAKKNF